MQELRLPVDSSAWRSGLSTQATAFHPPSRRRYFNPNSSETPQPGDGLTFAEELDLLDKLRRCPKCGAEHYSERSVTRRHPASPGASDSTTET